MNRGDYQVLVLDSELAVRSALKRLLSARGYRVRLHSDSEEFFRAGLPKAPACLLLDDQLSGGMTGTEVHAEIMRRKWSLPTVFIATHWNVRSVVQAMRDGADGFVPKPLDPEELLDAVNHALQGPQIRAGEGLQVAKIRKLAATLTVRELQIVRLVMKGLLNKQIADELGLALVTIKLHRGRAMKKLGAGNPFELARFASLAGLCD